jgi:uncharacterized membrane protein YjjB (DUF3815 family)
MLAHAARWELLRLGTSVEVGAFVASLLVGIIATPIADRLRMPFAAFAFASIVSLIPGVYLFDVASGLVAVIKQGPALANLGPGILESGTTAFVIILAITIGLIVPRMCLEGTLARMRHARASP